MPQNEGAKHGKASTMSGDDFQPDPPDHLLRWDENLAPHVEPFPPQTPPGEASFDALGNILQTIAQWYVRKDGKYYDVEEFGPVFSRDDVERIIVQRLIRNMLNTGSSVTVIAKSLNISRQSICRIKAEVGA
jgi:hypothetical protein